MGRKPKNAYDVSCYLYRNHAILSGGTDITAYIRWVKCHPRHPCYGMSPSSSDSLQPAVKEENNKQGVTNMYDMQNMWNMWIVSLVCIYMHDMYNMQWYVKYVIMVFHMQNNMNSPHFDMNSPLFICSIYRQASFIKPLMAEQRRHVSCAGDGGIEPTPSKSKDWTLLSP